MKLEKIKVPNVKPRNHVVKNMQGMSGAGRHEEKQGKNAKRAKQKQQFRREMRSMYENAGTSDIAAKLVQLLDRLENDVDFSEAPPNFNNEEASAWASGFTAALHEIRRELGL